MKQIDDLQKKFLESVINSDIKLDWIKSENKSDRINIYKSSIIGHYIKVLSQAFPLTSNLIGNDIFTQIASVFVIDKDNLPRNACLDYWGENFPKFLIRQFPKAEYLKDLAIYEITLNKVYNSSYQESIRLEEFLKIDESLVGEIKIKFVDSIEFFESNYPIHEIEDYIKSGMNSSYKIEEKKSYAILFQTNSSVETLWLTAEIYIFFQKLYKGYILEKAIDAVIAITKDFNLEFALSILLSNNLIKNEHNLKT
jgi:hypothetical protein